MTDQTSLILALAQVNPTVGAIDANADLILQWAAQAKQEFAADIVVFPELVLTGYPPEDLLFRPGFIALVEAALDKIHRENPGLCLVFGAPRHQQDCLYNSAVISQPGQPLQFYDKQHLPNYGVFDEQRYFVPANDVCTLQVKGVTLGILVCEDIWFPQPMAQAVAAGAECIININASPFHDLKTSERITEIKQRIAENKVPVCYVNLVGGQDELVFDGHSFVIDRERNLLSMAAGFEQGLSVVQYQASGELTALTLSVAENSSIEQLYQALVLATRDYVIKNGFQRVALGLSGGIDSALVLAIAVDALGADAVQAIMMPYEYTADISKTDAADEARRLGVEYSEIPISAAVQAFVHSLEGEFSGLGRDVTEENLQARSRGVILMAISNKKGALLLTTGNKSEMSVGYATLYGDMAGGFAPLKDVSKLKVYALARYRNTLSPVIPERVIERPPSAELAPDQIDQDSLPPYELLDPILAMYIEQDRSVEEIIRLGYDQDVVKRVTWLVDVNEYKRRQSPPGVKVTHRAFGKERRYPITSGFRQS
ncbi:MAG: NAD+ synthase [Gammaproteobacteria bacterium]|nr:NAD+ synthase [Gammaproteobacteria bacterium]